MADKKVPIRTCICCRQQFDKKQLVRIVKNNQGDIFCDKTGKADGRGAYFCGKQECYNKLKKSKLLNKVFKVEVGDEVYESIAEVVFGKEV